MGGFSTTAELVKDCVPKGQQACNRVKTKREPGPGLTVFLGVLESLLHARRESPGAGTHRGVGAQGGFWHLEGMVRCQGSVCTGFGNSCWAHSSPPSLGVQAEPRRGGGLEAQAVQTTAGGTRCLQRPDGRWPQYPLEGSGLRRQPWLPRRARPPGRHSSAACCRLS